VHALLRIYADGEDGNGFAVQAQNQMPKKSATAV
jgi:hypothetical protein